jgi:hypothetical protein
VLWHEAKLGQLLHDKANRLIRVASLLVLRDNINKLPESGRSTSRELPKLGEAALRCLFARGAINRSSTREDVDRLRSAQTARILTRSCAPTCASLSGVFFDDITPTRGTATHRRESLASRWAGWGDGSRRQRWPFGKWLDLRRGERGSYAGGT